VSAEPRPAVGELALDTSTGRVGQVMDHMHGRVQLRPAEGGCEWEAQPEAVRPAPQPKGGDAR
jgi:hypothetical protein